MGMKTKSNKAKRLSGTAKIAESALDREFLNELLKRWRQKLICYSAFATLPVIMASQAPEVSGGSTIEPRQGSYGKVASLPALVNRSCSKPALLRREVGYFLPGQKTRYDFVTALAGGGDNCPGTEIPSGSYTANAPFTDTGNTSGANDTVGCFCYYCYSPAAVSGSDLIYSFKLTSRGTAPEIRVTAESQAYDPAIYVLSFCPNPIPNSCYFDEGEAYANNWGPGGAEVLNSDALNRLPLNVPLYLFIDSPASNNSGPYTLRVQDITIGSGQAKFDYNGDGRSDLSVWRPSDGNWYIAEPGAGTIRVQRWGLEGDKLVPADFDGDGKTDLAVFRPSNGTWYVYMSQTQTFQEFGWGQNGDLPVPTDRDNDGRTDLVIFRPSNNTWYTRFANGTFAETVFGVAGDKPVVGDFDGDGIGDIALFRPSNHNWYILKSSLGSFVQTWGVPGDLPLTGDFDGDRATDQAVYRPSTGEWYLSQTTAGFAVRTWGLATDIPVPADFDADGKADVAIFRPSEGNWYIINSTAGIQIQQFGQNGDVPTQSAFNY